MVLFGILEIFRPRMKEPTNPYGWVRQMGSLLTIPMTLGLAPLVGVAIGFGLDRVFATKPIFMMIGLGCGFVAGIRETWRLIRRNSEEDDKNQ